MAAQYPTAAGTDANLFVAANNLSTSLNGAHTNVITTITVASTTGFPTAGYITIDAEAIAYTGTTGTTFTGCTRGADGTTAASHLNATQVFHDVVAAHHNVLKDEIKAVEGDLVSARAAITSGGSTLASALTAVQTQLNNSVLLTGNQTVAGVKSFSSAIKNTAGTNTIQVSGVSTTGQIGNNYDLGSIPNAADSSAAISFLCPAGAASVLIATSATVNTAVSTVASFANAGVAILGTNTNDSAAAGNVGERISSYTAATVTTGSNQWFDATSISLTAGDWDVSIASSVISNNNTITTSAVGITTTSGNSSTGITYGDTAIDTQGVTANGSMGSALPAVRMSLTTTTTVYFKQNIVYTVISGTLPQARGRITARRVR